MIDNGVFLFFFSCLNQYNYEFTFVMSHEIQMKQTLILPKWNSTLEIVGPVTGRIETSE